MSENIKDIIADCRKWRDNAHANNRDDLSAMLDALVARLEGASGYVTPKAALDAIEPSTRPLDAVLMNPPLAALKPPTRTKIISAPRGAAMKYNPLDPELPNLSAFIDSATEEGNGKPVQHCTMYVGREELANMTIYRGKHFAIRMCKGAMKSAMSRLGKHRRMTANRRARETAERGAA